MNKDFIYQLSNRLEEETKKIPPEENPDITYTIYYGKEDEKETPNVEKFRILMQDRKVKEARIWIYSTSKKIYTHIQDYKIGCEVKNENAIDDNWAIGVRTRLFEIFERHKAIRHSLTTARLVPLSLLISACFSYIIFLIIDRTSKIEYNDNFVIFLVVLTFDILLGVFYLFRWLFPKIETEFMERIKFRKMILAGIIGGLPLFMIGIFITSFLLR